MRSDKNKNFSGRFVYQHSCLQAKRPGYREGTALCICRFPARGREAAKEAERSDILIVNLRDAAGRG
ncbi:hypothetical protein CBW22_13105 [Pantoea sp. VS1]|nr:hypothetical protein CBW22_13105 [Pantoea sp. VS1]